MNVCVCLCERERERESERDIGRRGCEGDFLISAKEDLDFFQLDENHICLTFCNFSLHLHLRKKIKRRDTFFSSFKTKRATSEL